VSCVWQTPHLPDSSPPGDADRINIAIGLDSLPDLFNREERQRQRITNYTITIYTGIVGTKVYDLSSVV